MDFRTTLNEDEANLIVAGLDLIVKAAGLSRPDQFQMAHGIMTKMQTAQMAQALADKADADADAEAEAARSNARHYETTVLPKKGKGK